MSRAESNLWSLTFEGKLGLRWRDSRLALAPCKLRIGQMLSFSQPVSAARRREADADRTLLWLPSPALNGSTITFQEDARGSSAGPKNEVSAASFRYLDGRHPSAPPYSYDGSGGVEAEFCAHGCVALNLTLSQTMTFSPALRFDAFPFDTQELRLSLDLGAGSSIATCDTLFFYPPPDPSDPSASPPPASFLGGLNQTGRLERLLPSSGEWRFQAVGRPVYAEHPLVHEYDGETLIDAWVDTSKCDLVFLVQRNAFGALMQKLFPTVLAVYLGLLCILLHPADHSGDRMAILGVSVLILIFNMQARAASPRHVPGCRPVPSPVIFNMQARDTRPRHLPGCRRVLPEVLGVACACACGMCRCMCMCMCMCMYMCSPRSSPVHPAAT